MHKGYIYIMTNPCLKDMVKIGFATDVETRRRQLSTTALPYEYEIYATYETSGKLEDKKLHKMIGQLNPELRVSKNREFFLMSPDEAYNLLEAIAVISGSKDKLKKEKATDDIEDDSDLKVRKPPINFSKCGIPIGAELVYIDDPSIKVIVVDDHKVQYGDELTSLSAIARGLKGHPASGPRFFMYNGKTVKEIARETQWKN